MIRAIILCVLNSFSSAFLAITAHRDHNNPMWVAAVILGFVAVGFAIEALSRFKSRNNEE